LDEEDFENFSLPQNMKGVGPHLSEDTLLRSIATALHVHTTPITGQLGSKSNLEKNPGVFMNPDQPLVQALTISDDDIKMQEERVQAARRKLEKALNEFGL